MAVSARGREARTHYASERAWSEPAVALLRCRLETGRTHQIRVHLAAIGHPVVGDRQYRGVRPDLRPPRIFLHAARLGFHHPADNHVVTFESALPPDLQAVLDALE
jgi:23S rRNA pseudouridine1911/1915/1917 synthase